MKIESKIANRLAWIGRSFWPINIFFSGVYFAQENPSRPVSEYPDYGWILIIGVGFILGLICFIFAVRNRKKQRFIENIPTSKTTGVFLGLVEVKGEAESNNPLKSFLTEKECVYYSYRIEEQWSRKKTETYRDKNGTLKTRVRTESGWERVSSHTASRPFFVKDDYGVIRINPEKADIKPRPCFRRTVSEEDPLYYSKGPGISVPDSKGRRRFIEEIIELHQPVYVIGQAREREDKIEPEIAFEKTAPLFVVSGLDEKKTKRDFSFNFWVLTVLGWLLSIGGWAVKDLGYDIPLKEDLRSFLLISAGYLGILVLSLILLTYNDLIQLRQYVRQGRSNIEVQLARRHSLIPSLEAVVKGFKIHEMIIQETLAALRSQSAVSGTGTGEVIPIGLAPRFSAIKEAYQELDAEEGFLALQKQLSETETRIALARSYYNDIANNYNTRLQTIPDVLIAKMAFLKSAPLFEAENFVRPAPEIE